MLGANSVATPGNFTKPHVCILANLLPPDFIFILLLFFFGSDFLGKFLLLCCIIFFKLSQILLQKGKSYVSESISDLELPALLHFAPSF